MQATTTTAVLGTKFCIGMQSGAGRYGMTRAAREKTRALGYVEVCDDDKNRFILGRVP